MVQLSSLTTALQRVTRHLSPWKGTLRAGVQIAVLLAIVWQLSHTGWKEVWNGLPVHPMFYVLQVIVFVLLPAVEIRIYRPYWDLPYRTLFGMFLRKRVFNEEIAGYSGEANLLMEVRARTGIETRPLVRVIRDVAIVSAMSANVITLVLLGLVLAFDWMPLPTFHLNWSVWHLLLGLVVAIAAAAAMIRFRKALYAFSLRETFRVGGLHSGRFILQHLLMMLQWAVVVPHVPAQGWLVYITVWVVINRLPFLPGKDLLFVSASIPLAGAMGDPTAEFAAMWVVSAVLNKVMSLAVLVLYRDRKRTPKRSFFKT